MERKCSGCHDLSIVANVRHSRGEWQAVVQRMIGRGASLTPHERRSVVEYLARLGASGGSGGVSSKGGKDKQAGLRPQ